MGATNVSKYSDFKALDRRVVDEIVAETERSPFFRAEPSRLGFRTTKVRYDVAERVEGKSKWNFKSLSKYAVNAVTGYSDFPLRIPFYVGAVWGIVGLVLLIASIIAAFASGPAWRLLVVALLFDGSQLVCERVLCLDVHGNGQLSYEFHVHGECAFLCCWNLSVTKRRLNFGSCRIRIDLI